MIVKGKLEISSGGTQECRSGSQKLTTFLLTFSLGEIACSCFTLFLKYVYETNIIYCTRI